MQPFRESCLKYFKFSGGNVNVNPELISPQLISFSKNLVHGFAWLTDEIKLNGESERQRERNKESQEALYLDRHVLNASAMSHYFCLESPKQQSSFRFLSLKHNKSLMTE